MFLKFAYRPVSNVALLNRNALETIDNDVFQLIIYCFYCVWHMRSSTFETGLIYRAMVKLDLKIVGRKIMKFLHEMIPIFVLFSQDGLQFPPSLIGFKNTAGVIVFIEFTGTTSYPRLTRPVF